MPAPVDLTWQQREEFVKKGPSNSRARRRKGGKPKKFEPFAVHEPEEPTTDNSAWMAAIDEVPPLAEVQTPKPFLKRQRNHQPSTTSDPKMSVPAHLRKQQSARKAQTNTVKGPQATTSNEIDANTNPSHSPAEEAKPNGGKQNFDGASKNGEAKTAPEKPKFKNRPQPRNFAPRPKRSQWPRASDMKALPTDSNSEGGVTFKSNSNGDEEYDVKKLVDWEGNWLPAPEVWSARPGHAHRHFGRDMENWMNTHSTECTRGINIHTGQYVDEESSDSPPSTSTDYKEVVPPYWALGLANYKPAAEYWPEFVADKWAEANADKWEKEFPELFPYAATDKPWWERYERSESFFLNSLSVPDASIDQEDPQNHIDKYGLESANARMDAMKRRAVQKQQRTLAKRNRPIPVINTMLAPADDKKIVTKEHFYLRPVQPSDVCGIMKIYNHYVEESIHAPELYPRTEEHIRDRINDVTEAKLPYLVAIKKGLNYNAYEADSSEQVLAFVNLDEEYSATSMSRYTFVMELFVHPGFCNKGIAKCLLDRVLGIVNSGYNLLGGYEYMNDSGYLLRGPAQRIKSILLNVFHEHGDDITWKTKLLSDFKFVRKGHLTNYGFKNGKEVDMTIYQHITTEIIDPYMK